MNVEITNDENGIRTAKVDISPKKTVTMKELGGGDLRTVKRLSGYDLQLVSDNLYLYALTQINDEKLVPVANEMHLQARANKFSLKEYTALREAYDTAFEVEGDEKND